MMNKLLERFDPTRQKIWKISDALLEALDLAGEDVDNLLFLRIMGELSPDFLRGCIEALADIGPEDSLLLLFDSGGGDITNSQLFISWFNALRRPVVALATGYVASAALMIYMAVPKEKRFALRGSRFLAHLATSKIGGTGIMDPSNGRFDSLGRELVQKIIDAQLNEAEWTQNALIKYLESEIGKHVVIGGVEFTIQDFVHAGMVVEAPTAERIGIVGKII